MIINLSPHRSGTQSVANFFADHGFRTFHAGTDANAIQLDGLMEKAKSAEDIWSLTRPFVEGFEFLSDLPFPIIYRQLYAAYPNARFMIVVRDPSAWVRSVLEHTNGRDLSYLERGFYGWTCGRKAVRLEEYSREELVAAYCDFVRSVVRHCGARVFGLNDPTIAWDLAAYSGFKQVCGFATIR
jgi:hypothetical protein